MKKAKKIVITGGHLSPALSVIEALGGDYEILIIGRKYAFEGDYNFSLEYKISQEKNLPFYPITAGRLQRRFTRYTILSLLKFPLGLVQSLKILKRQKPDLIVTFGGYVSLPVVLSGAIFSIPIIIHEQTRAFGLANKIASFFAKKVAISWESSRRFFPKEKTVLTGIPIKKFRISDFGFRISDKKLPLLYVTGGSAGSHAINTLVEGCLKELALLFNIIHQTGDSAAFNDFEKLNNFIKNEKSNLQKRYVLKKFVSPYEVVAILKECNLVVSRGGANTVSELIYYGKPALIIPLNAEQMQNAQFMKKLGLAEILDQDKATPQIFLEKIKEMISKIKDYEKNKELAKKSLVENADAKIVEQIKILLRT